jgi:hypothetical protein
MAKKPAPKPDSNDPNEDLDEVQVPEGPCPWNVEIEFIDPGKKSAMYSVRAVVLDSEHIQLELEDGKLIAYMFAHVSKVLTMHSTRYDAYLIDSKRTGEATAE